MSLCVRTLAPARAGAPLRTPRPRGTAAVTYVFPESVIPSLALRLAGLLLLIFMAALPYLFAKWLSRRRPPPRKHGAAMSKRRKS
jgi:hypothetical protein